MSRREKLEGITKHCAQYKARYGRFKICHYPHMLLLSSLMSFGHFVRCSKRFFVARGLLRYVTQTALRETRTIWHRIFVRADARNTFRSSLCIVAVGEAARADVRTLKQQQPIRHKQIWFISNDRRQHMNFANSVRMFDREMAYIKYTDARHTHAVCDMHVQHRVLRLRRIEH